jgi:AcrR family transcriptional regulator
VETRAGQRAQDVHEAALTLFAERGYNGTTMKDIAGHLQMRAPSLYNHVNSKQEILREIMLNTAHQLLAEFREATRSEDDEVEALRRAIAVFVAHHAHHPREALIGNRDVASLEEPARSELLALRREHEHSIRDLIEKVQARRRVVLEHAHLTSFAMLEMGVSVARWFRQDGPLSAEEIGQHYGDLAVRMCSTTEGPAT